MVMKTAKKSFKENNKSKQKLIAQKKRDVHKEVEKSDEKENIEIKNFNEYKFETDSDLTAQKIAQTLELLLKEVAFNTKSNKKNDSLFSDERYIELQIAAIKLPKEKETHLLRVCLPNNYLNDPSGGCLLVVKDLEKGLNVDHQKTAQHFAQLLQSHDVKDVFSSQVMPLRELKTEYKEFECKTALCHKFEKVLVDERIVRLVPMFLGKAFYKRRKLPTPTCLTAKNLKDSLSKAIRTSTLPLSHTSVSSQITIGNVRQEITSLVENISSVVKVLKQRFPGGWSNIRSIYVKTSKGTSLPLHVSDVNPNDVKLEDVKFDRREKRVKRQTETDELSTLPGSVVKVNPFGGVTVKRVEKLPDEDLDLLDDGVMNFHKIDKKTKKINSKIIKENDEKSDNIEDGEQKPAVDSRKRFREDETSDSSDDQVDIKSESKENVVQKEVSNISSNKKRKVVCVESKDDDTHQDEKRCVQKRRREMSEIVDEKEEDLTDENDSEDEIDISDDDGHSSSDCENEEGDETTSSEDDISGDDTDSDDESNVKVVRDIQEGQSDSESD